MYVCLQPCSGGTIVVSTVDVSAVVCRYLEITEAGVLHNRFGFSTAVKTIRDSLDLKKPLLCTQKIDRWRFIKKSRFCSWYCGCGVTRMVRLFQQAASMRLLVCVAEGEQELY